MQRRPTLAGNQEQVLAADGLVAIGLCADTHYWPEGQNFVTSDGSLQLQGFSEVLLSTLLQELARSQLDLVLHLGDLTCGGGTYGMTLEDFGTTLANVYTAFGAHNMVFYALPGNHDSEPDRGGWRTFRQLSTLGHGEGLTIDLAGVRLVLLNAQGHSAGQIADAREGDPVYGWVNEEELARLEGALATAGARPVILFSHQLLLPWSDVEGWRDFYGVSNAGAVLATLTRHSNVRAVFQGHAHRFDVQTVQMGARDCTFVVLPSLIEYPLAWLRLEVSRTAARMQLQRLPLPELLEASRTSGGGQSWRDGRAEWWEYTIPFN